MDGLERGSQHGTATDIRKRKERSVRMRLNGDDVRAGCIVRLSDFVKPIIGNVECRNDAAFQCDVETIQSEVDRKHVGTDTDR
jgi:hypothetical protein